MASRAPARTGARAGAGEGAGAGEVTQDGRSADSMEGRQSPPPWIGDPPTFWLMHFITTPIPNSMLFGGSKIFFDRSLSVPGNEGDYAIPLAIAVPMIFLHQKHREELLHGRSASFINTLDHPIPPGALPWQVMKELVQLLFQASSLDECVQRFSSLTARMIFEVLVNVIQRAENLRVHVTYKTSSSMAIADFLRPGSWSQHPPPQPTQTMEEYMEQVKSAMIEEAHMKLYFYNILLYELYEDLKLPENQHCHLILRYILVNLTRLLRDFCMASALPDGLRDDRSLLFAYAGMRVESMSTILRVLGLKFGRYLIQAPPTSLQRKGPNQAEGAGDGQPPILAERILTNAILMNTPEAWYCGATVPEFLLHSVPDCNLQNPQCLCWSFLQIFPGALEG
ncbi:hypothetical protein EGR_07617 [Echinococcus granulosus]|uniref:Uncharacterized protein n=1 Tax=Echinococcus granulosus TaxID=6210 RepID=W6UAH1_ECHGR|nr:hypothetical protein EGR_07617 [Echinococcus granulosus]EUB57526.1 hypothetical protein EGR_07617 [Echinococcus granulosus]